jgi:hypothetical protein
MGFQAHWDKARDIDEDKFDSMHLQKENAALAQGVTAHQLRGDRYEFDVRPRDCGTDGRKASLTITKYCILDIMVVLPYSNGCPRGGSHCPIRPCEMN